MSPQQTVDRNQQNQYDTGLGLWDTSRVADEFGVSVRTVGNWVKNGLIPSIKWGGRRYFDPVAIRQAILKQQTEPSKE